MPDDNQKTTAVKDELVIPKEVKEKFPDLVQMILDSESMDNDERRYWFSVLPIMTKEQVQELRDILETEKKKLAEIDAKYSADTPAPKKELTQEDLSKAEDRRREAKAKRIAEEKKHQEEAGENAEAMLDELG